MKKSKKQPQKQQPGITSHASGASVMKVVELYRRYVQPYQRVAVAIIALSLIACSVTSIIITRQRAKQARGFALLKSSKDADMLVGIADDYKGTLAGAQATFRIARQLYDDANYAEAAAKFSSFCQEYPNSAMVEAARLGEAYSMEGAAKLGQAEKMFVEIAEQTQNTLTSAEAYVAAGRLARVQGKLAEAEKWYQRVVSSTTTGMYAEKASEALKQLKQLRPTDEK